VEPINWHSFFFLLFALVACAFSVAVVVTSNVVRMAFFLIVALGATAGLFFLAGADFVGAMQLMIYVGGTLVLLVFGVMLTSKSPWVRFDSPLIERIGAGVVCALLAICIAVVLTRSTFQGAVGVVPGAAVEAIGRRLITVYLVPFEVAGVLLMIVMVGAAHLARQEKQ
jgi:NADH:ubiquinone oxidoreductase subunit 6 (subunit J)